MSVCSWNKNEWYGKQFNKVCLEVVPRNDLVLFSRLQIDFGRDFERQLDCYVDARSSFSNLETVLVMLVQVMF